MAAMATELKFASCAFRPLSDEDDGESDTDKNGGGELEEGNEEAPEEETEDASKEESYKGGLDG